MHIADWSPEPLHEINYGLAEENGHVSTACLQVTRASAASLPEGLDALILTSDLQGREWPPPLRGGDARLAGELVADELATLAELGVLPKSDRVGVILAGDLYAKPDLAGRGGSGDVRVVWQAFRDRFRWVCGVGGNHDLFGKTAVELAEFAKTAGTHYLDGDLLAIDNLRIAGVGGIIGRESKSFRRSESQFRSALRQVLAARPDLLVLHCGPDVPSKGLPGNVAVRECLEAAAPTLLVCGHCHWPAPIQTLANGTQVCNVDARVVVLERFKSERANVRVDSERG